MNMVKCEECGKKLGILEGYRHPTMGKKHLLCGSCHDSVCDSIKKYQEFLSPYADFFKTKSPTPSYQEMLTNLKNNIKSIRSHKNFKTELQH